MPIKGLSEVRRLPRLGAIRLGVKKLSEGGKSYPAEVDYFVCPAEVEEVFGEKPKALRVMFPVDNPDVFFPQWLKCYGASLLKCKGDGEKAFTWDEEGGGLKEIACPCPKLEAKECKQIGILQFLIPECAGAGVYQITTSSKNSIIDLNSSLSFIRAICGRVNMIPLVLKREPMLMQRIEAGKPKKSTHYTLKLDLDEKVTLCELQRAAQVAPERILLPPPDETKDDLLFPPNGFKPENESEAEAEAEEEPAAAEAGKREPEFKLKQEAEPKAASEDQKKALGCLLAELAEMKFLPRKAEQKRLEVLKTADEYEAAIKYYESVRIRFLRRG
jgi:hypothetical protein